MAYVCHPRAGQGRGHTAHNGRQKCSSDHYGFGISEHPILQLTPTWMPTKERKVLESRIRAPGSWLKEASHRMVVWEYCICRRYHDWCGLETLPVIQTLRTVLHTSLNSSTSQKDRVIESQTCIFHPSPFSKPHPLTWLPAYLHLGLVSGSETEYVPRWNHALLPIPVPVSSILISAITTDSTSKEEKFQVELQVLFHSLHTFK